MPRLVHKQIIAVLDQPSVGTAVSPVVATDSVLVQDLSFSFVNENIIQREVIRSTSRAQTLQPCNVGRMGELTFSCEIKSSGVVATVPEVSRLLRICGYDETIIPVMSVSYNLTPSPGLFATISFYYDGWITTLIDCVGTHTTSLSANQLGMDNFTITGRVSTIVAGALPTPSYDAVKPVALNNLNITYNGDLIHGMNSLEIDLGNEISNDQSLSASDGYEPPFLVSNNTTGSFTTLMNTPQLHDWDSLWSSNAVFPLLSAEVGSVSGNRYSIVLPAMSITSVTQAAQGKLLAYNIGVHFNESTGNTNDQFSRVYR